MTPKKVDFFFLMHFLINKTWSQRGKNVITKSNKCKHGAGKSESHYDVSVFEMELLNHTENAFVISDLPLNKMGT